MKHWALCGVFFVGLVINVMICVQRDSGMEQTDPDGQQGHRKLKRILKCNLNVMENVQELPENSILLP